MESGRTARRWPLLQKDLLSDIFVIRLTAPEGASLEALIGPAIGCEHQDSSGLLQRTANSQRHFPVEDRAIHLCNGETGRATSPS